MPPHRPMPPAHAKARTGRPPRSTEAATIIIAVRLTPSEAAAIGAKLKPGEKPGEWLRRVGLQRAGVKSPR
jgi:hypothetical protein